MPAELSKTYEPQEVETSTYAKWQEAGYFHMEADPDKKPYCIVIPPPNITGQLHMGHALNNTLQDVLIRYRRMQGYCTLWLPGTDHASIATEAKIVESMKADGLTKADLGRDGFLKRAWEWRELYGNRIVEQLKKLGSSCDWERIRFTLDEGLNKAVNEVFVRLYEEGLIYRGERMINWCPHCRTSISEAEVEHDDKDGHFWHVRYPLTDGEGYIEVATTRPETMLGDTAVAVHPEDERYRHLVGKTVMLPLMDRPIPIIADSYVEPDFGTGIVKITPAHDPNDFEVGRRHDLPVIDIMTDDAHINEQGGKYAGMERYEARKAVVADLEALGLLVKTEAITHSVGACYRCRSVVEPKVSMQWFVRMDSMAKEAIDAVRKGETKIIPERFEKIYFHWMENTRDWCISRQLWWGHRIPAWYCADCGQITVTRGTAPDRCAHCGGRTLAQDEDTLDTWFSSALWPFSTLGWPDSTADLDYFYPTGTLVTAYDILTFWVSRMIFSGVHQMGKAPFDTVLIHGIVRDKDGRKMSKSLGNGIDPLTEIETYGADALRFSLATGNAPGGDMRYTPERVESSRNFANKLWNAARFVLMNLPEGEPAAMLPPLDRLALEDKYVIGRFMALVTEVTDNLNRFELGLAVQKLYDFIWDIFCDWTIEISKLRLTGDDAEAAATARAVLVWVMTGFLRLLHPFMPFITEEIFLALPHQGESIMVSEWPTAEETLLFADEAAEFDKVIELIRALRARRAEMNVPPAKRVTILIETKAEETFAAAAGLIARLAGGAQVLVNTGAASEDAVTVVTAFARADMPLDELVDRAAERARLDKELVAAQSDIAFILQKLDNAEFVAKAPARVVDDQRARLKVAQDKVAELEKSLKAYE